MTNQGLRAAWQEPAHADLFDTRAELSLGRLRRAYEHFNEFRLLLAYKRELRGRDFVEIGCATGELYRYLRGYHPDFRYSGFDISRPAIQRARQKYPRGRFELCSPDLSGVVAAGLKPAVVWARDVLQHQPDPFAYLAGLLAISDEATILRIRTRDKGSSVLDPEVSCQWHYNHWVPYIILNVDETVDAICRAIPVRRLIVVKRYVQLGGWHNRFVPKECYEPHTGTAETALCVLRAADGRGAREILVSAREDGDLAVGASLWRLGLRHLRRRLAWRPPERHGG